MSDVNAYLFEIELALIDNPIVADYCVVRSWANADDGYIRIRATLTNGDFVEMAEYFATEENDIVTIDYRHQWMDRTKETLRRRWDSTPDHPEVACFPHHVHLAGEETVVPGRPISSSEVLHLLEVELARV